MTELQKSPMVDFRGFLLRYETFKGRSGWKKRWAVLCDFCLYLYKDPTSKECFFALLLPNSTVTQSHDSTGQYRSSIKVEEPNQQPVFLSTETPLDFDTWFDALSLASQQRKISIPLEGGLRDEQTLIKQQQYTGDSRQQFSQQSQQRTVVTTTTTTSGFETSMERSGQKYQGDYPDGGGGSGSQPTLATADGQYSVRQQQVSLSATNAVGAGGAGAAVSVGRSPSEVVASDVVGTFVEHHQQQFYEEGMSHHQQQQQQQRSEQMLVRAEPVRPAPPPVPKPSVVAGTNNGSMSGRYEIRTETQRQQRSGGRANSGGYAGLAGGPLGASEISLNRRPIETVREDPQMDDSEVIATAPLDEIKRKYPVSGLAKRMSIAASDLLGKSHDELLLLLIQLNREKAALERRRDYYLALLHRQPNMRGADRMQADLRDIDNQIELHDPLITFIGNIISMGALYNGDDVMFASEYRQHLLQPGEVKPVKENVGFIRRQQERQLSRQLGDQSGSCRDLPDGVQLPGSVESQEFRVTRHQLESELRELESVYADHRRRKGDLAAFMTDLGHRVASGRLGGGYTVERRTVVGSASDDVFQQQQRSSSSATSGAGGGFVVKSAGGGGGAGVNSAAAAATTTTTTTVITSVDNSDRFGRIPDPEEFIRQRRANTTAAAAVTTTAAVSSSNSALAGLPPGQPPPEVYVSQPQLYRADHLSGRGGNPAASSSASMSVQDRLNVALGFDTTDSMTLPPVVRSTSTSRSPGSQTTLPVSASSTKKPLITLDASRYKRTTNFACAEPAGGLDHRTQALENLGEFIEDMKGLQRGTYYRVDQ